MKRLTIAVLAIFLCPVIWAQYGSQDGAACDGITGWAADPGQPDAAVTVDIYHSPNWWGPQAYYTSVVANRYRSDGHGYHGFSLPVPLAYRDGQMHYWLAKYQGISLGLGAGAGVACSPMGGYTYYLVNDFAAQQWSQNGSMTSTPALVAPSASGGAWISNVAVPDGSSEYEVKTTLHLPGSGGTYISYLRASPDAMSGPSAQGTFYSVELQNPTFTGGSCWATLAILKRQSGVVTWLAAAGVSCHDGMTIRSVQRTDSIFVFVDDTYTTATYDTTIASGKPGVGAYATAAGNSIAEVALGRLDRTAPYAVDPQSVSVLALPNRVDLQWRAAGDDANGAGIWMYGIVRNGTCVCESITPELSDQGVQPGTTYTYTIWAWDRHYNYGPSITVSVTTPPAGTIDQRQIGLRPTGAYWGGAGEQIDMRSGNLNFTLPLLKAQGRGGWGVPFALSYNSQIWRQESGRDWKVGRDVGYGIGWRLQAGSITPYWSDFWVIRHYVFTDSTGAEYRLTARGGGLWASNEGTYVEYDDSSNRLYFPDGSFWVMGAVSGGTEDDAGTRYPTMMQDTNGNQVLVRYYAGAGVPWPDSSARIKEIEDARAPQDRGKTYSFTYNSSITDPTPHLVHITNYISTAENFDFTYSAQNLISPFSQWEFSGTTLLTGVTVSGLGLGHTMEYVAVGTGTSGELSKVTLPHRGWLRWAYRQYTYTTYGNRTLREVQYRYLGKAVGAAETTYTLYHDDGGDAGRTVLYYTDLVDPGGTAKVWVFNTDPAQWNVGLLSWFEDRTSPWITGIRRQTYYWNSDAAGTGYIGSTWTVLEPDTANQKISGTTQVVDTHGNVTTSSVYGYASQSTPVRTYNHTYQTYSGYTSRHI